MSGFLVFLFRGRVVEVVPCEEPEKFAAGYIWQDLRAGRLGTTPSGNVFDDVQPWTNK